MIHEKNRALDVRSTLQGEGIGLSLDENSLAHIMSVLTDLYSDPELAVVREYATNAHDAHIEAGTSRPVEITLPSRLAPFLRIKDYGVGLSVEDVHNIYSKYGASTKRATNEQTGMLGLGCKAALTYSDQFSVEAVKNGTKIIVSVSRNAEGAGTMHVVDTRAADEPNGVEVVVPVKRENTMIAKAVNFFRFWPKGSVLLNGEEPSRIDGLWLSDSLLVIDAVGENTDYVVQGGVAYPCDLNTGLEGRNLVAFVDIGDVDFVPSREALHHTAHTKKTCAAVVENLHHEVATAVQREIDASAEPHEAIAVLLRWRGALPSLSGHTFTHKGMRMPLRVALPDNAPRLVHLHRLAQKLSRHTYRVSVGANEFSGTMWLTGYSHPAFTPTQRKKLDQWFASSNADVNQFILIPEDAKLDLYWIDPSLIGDWAEVREQRLPRNLTAGGRLSGSYAVWVGDELFPDTPANDLDPSFPILYINANWRKVTHYRRALIEEHGDDFALVCLPANRVDKFKRDFPDAVEARQECSRLADRWWSKIGEDDRLAIVVQTSSYDYSLSSLDAERVEDPELARGIRLAKKDISKLRSKQGMLSRFANFDGPAYTNPLDSYPLYNHHSFYRTGGRYTDHLYIYFNAVYQKEN